MKDLKIFFKGKKITVMGLGLLGRGVGDTKFLAEQGAELIVTDLKSETDLASSLEQLKGFSNITYRLGRHELADFCGRDFILQAAGVPLDSLYIAEARHNNIPIKMSASWFAELAELPIVGVTGTRGKSTTTHLLNEMMQAAGMQVLLGGNVLGVSTLALLPQVEADSIALMELDSWQLQGFGKAKLSPNIAVFTTFMPDHLNYYKTISMYFADKTNIFLHQRPDDVLVASSQVASLIKEKYGQIIVSHLVIADGANFPKDWELKLLGEHNKLNALCAIEAARALGIDDEIIRQVVAKFKGVPGRLELIYDQEGLKIYNDTTATTPQATLAALRALPATSNIILIMGGADKGLDMTELISEATKRCKKIILLTGSGTDKLSLQAEKYNDLEAAVRAAIETATAGDIILFSPAFASFGMFQNEFDRGEQFQRAVKKILGSAV